MWKHLHLYLKQLFYVKIIFSSILIFRRMFKYAMKCVEKSGKRYKEEEDVVHNGIS